MHSNSRVLKQLDNKFGNFAVEELIYDSRPARVLFSGPLHAAQSGLALDSNPRLLFDYNQRLLELALKLAPKDILLLGGGTLTLPTALINRLPEAHITAVEINSDLITLAKSYFGYRDEPRLEVIIDDAAHFTVKAKPHSYDLIITDLFDSLSIPESFLSLAFAKQLKRVLKPDGVVATNCIAALSGSGAAPQIKLSAAYEKAIGPVQVVKVDQQRYMNWTPQNLLLLSGHDITSLLKGPS